MTKQTRSISLLLLAIVLSLIVVDNASSLQFHLKSKFQNRQHRLVSKTKLNVSKDNYNGNNLSTSDATANGKFRLSHLLATSGNTINNNHIDETTSSTFDDRKDLLLSLSGGSTTSPNSNGDTDPSEPTLPSLSPSQQGRLLLVLVAVLYGTLNVVLRLVYDLPDPPAASALSTTRGWLAAGCFIPLLWNNSKKSNTSIRSLQDDDIDSSLSAQQTNDNDNNNNNNMWMAAMELAIWNFLAQGCLNLGLLSTSAARAAFLTQTSVVMTPIISVLAGQTVASSVWTGCIAALAGLVMLSSGGGGGVTSAFDLSFATGDWLVLGGALSWSMYLFRMSKLGGLFDEIKLQASKTTFLAICYTLWFLGSTFVTKTNLWLGWQNPIAWALLLYSALGPGTIADVVQQQGQSKVSASEANVILSLEPVFAALFAFLFMGEVTSLQEALGGAMILGGALIASR